MEQLITSALILWILTMMLQPDSFIAEVTNSLSPLQSQEQKSTTSPIIPQSHSLCEGPRNCTLQGGSAICSSRCLTSVPQNLPATITRLILKSNLLRDLPNFIFARYSSLVFLDLSFNSIKSLQNDTFYNLSMLKELQLFSNRLKLESLVYLTHVFRPLKSLVILNMARNYGGTMQYLDLTLSHLRNLETLVLDCPMAHTHSLFGDGFKNLTKLSDIKMSGNYKYTVALPWGLGSHTFNNVETIERLTLYKCGIQGNLTSGKPFHNLRKLRVLNLSRNSDIGITYLQPIFDGLWSLENLTALYINSIVNRYSWPHCLDVTYFKSFPRHLTILEASRNNLVSVDEEVISLLPINLTILDLSGNQFTIGAFLQKLPQLKKLTTLYLNGLQPLDGLPYFFPFERGFPKPKSSNCTTLLTYLVRFVIPLPPKLVTLEINNAGLNFNINEIPFNKTNSLTYLSASGNHFPNLKGPVIGFHSLKCLNLSVCGIQHIYIYFFNDLPSLEVLRLDSNDLGDFLFDATNEKVFSPLSNLKSLNLTNNGITVLPEGIFTNLTNLSYLYLRKNFLASFDVDLRSIVALSSLDLAQTHLFTLSKKTQAYFDNLIKNNRLNVTIYMENTPISCKCPNLQFLHWMTTSQAFPKPLHNYYCDIVYFKYKPIKDDYVETMTILRKHCASNALLLLFAVSATLAISSLIIGAIVYRFRWNIRYLYYAVYLRFKKNSNTLENEREYDAFICYPSEDAEFAEITLDKELSNRGLRIFLHGRDFKAGDYVSSNIVNAVCSSKKTVVLLTEALLDSYWCGYEIEMAKLEGINTGRPVLIFVFLEDIPKNKLSRDLLHNIKNNTYVEYSSSASDPDQMRVWWDKLANDIRS